jgi:hypothetical protein
MTVQRQFHNTSPTVSDGRGLFENLGAALAIGVLLITKPLTYRFYQNWGATDAEAQRALPGDDLVPRYRSQFTRALTIHAPPSAVWPWLVQLGQERGGLYSYERLENLAGCQMRNADRIVPEFQSIHIGDTVRLGPKGYPLFRIAQIEPERLLAWAAADPKTEQVVAYTDPMPADYNCSNWVFVLEAIEARTTRLLMRSRLDYNPPTLARRLLWGATDVIGFVMMRKMMLGIKAHAEASA